MLVLSRKAGERIVIGDNLVITVNRIAGNRVALGIEAPEKVRVMRSELLPSDSAIVETPSVAPSSPETVHKPRRILRRNHSASVLPAIPRRLMPMAPVGVATK